MNETTKYTLNLAIQILTIIFAFVAGKYNARQEQQITARIIFDECYHKIFTNIEKDFYSKKLSIEELHSHADKILNIFNQSKGYYYHSLEEYCRRLETLNDIESANETWLAFCWSFDRQLIKVEKSLGLPMRGFTYRANRRQYSDWTQLIKVYFLSAPLSIVLLALVLLPFVFQIISRFH